MKPVRLPLFHDIPLPPAPAPRTGYRVVGLDISLTGTGVAGPGWTETIPTKGHRADPLDLRHGRLAGIRDAALSLAKRPDLAVVEGPSHQSIGGSMWDRAGLWWLIVGGLMARGTPVAVVPPTCRAKYATGSGRAGKPEVMTAVTRRYDATPENDNEADAFVLHAMGLHWLGEPAAPVPDRHASALDRCHWPDLLAQ